jgi:hypothetical protein
MLYVLELMESYCCRLLKMGEKKKIGGISYMLGRNKK